MFLGTFDEKIFHFRCGRPPLPTSPMATLAVLAITTTAATLTTRRRDPGNLSEFLLSRCLGATLPTQTKDGNSAMCVFVAQVVFNISQST